MRIEFLTQEDPLYILPFFEEFIAHYSDEFEITRISCCRAMGKRPRLQLLRELLWLYGLPGLAKLLIQAGKAKILAKLPRRRESHQYYSIAQLAYAYGIPYERVENPNQPPFLPQLKQRAPDLLVSVACPFILKATALAVPRLGCINIHHAPLPRYKGMMPTFWQLYHGEEQLGVTIHYMAAKVDEGDALLQESMPANPGESLHQLIRKSKRYGAHCMARALRAIRSNSVAAVPLDHSKGSYFTFPVRSEALEFRRRGMRAI